MILAVDLGSQPLIGILLVSTLDGKRFRLKAYDAETKLATLEPEPEITLTINKIDFESRDIPTPPARSRFLPGDPQPWKSRGKRNARK